MSMNDEFVYFMFCFFDSYCSFLLFNLFFVCLLYVANSYDPREDKWNVLAEMTTARALAGCTVFKNKIYVIGTLMTMMSIYRYRLMQKSKSVLYIVTVCQSDSMLKTLEQANERRNLYVFRLQWRDKHHRFSGKLLHYHLSF